MAIKGIKAKDLFRAERKKRPKTYAKIDKRWDIKMIGPVLDFVVSVADDVNRKAILNTHKEYLIDGPKIERKLWKLLQKSRRITLLERKK